MKKYILFIITILLSCQNNVAEHHTSLISRDKEKIIRSLQLSDEELIILDEHYPDTLRTILLQNTLTLDEILILHEIGISKDIIIHLIKYTNSSYHLTTDDLVTLQLKGVPREIITIMIKT